MKIDSLMKHNLNSIQYSFSDLNLVSNKVSKKVLLINILTREEHLYDSIGAASISLKINKDTIASRCRSNNTVDNFKYYFIETGDTSTNKFKILLDSLGLKQKKALDKFIPKVYLFNTTENRVSLLQGLLDTDGYVSNKKIGFTTISEQLAKDVKHLVLSLGGSCRISERLPRQNGNIIGNYKTYELYISFNSSFNPFHCASKAEKFESVMTQHEYIVDVEYYSTEEVQCITVEDSSSLYVTDDFILTHNSRDEKMEIWLAPVLNVVK